MTRRTPLSAALPLCLVAAAALAAPPLAIPIPRPTPEQEALIAAEAEEDQIREELEEARQRAETAEPDAIDVAEPDAPVVAPPAPAPAPAPVVVAPPAPAPAPAVVGPPAPSIAPPAREADPASEVSASGSDSDVFRRDPFWPVSVARERKAVHDERVAARIEAAKREAAIKKAREDAIARGKSIDELDDELGGFGTTDGPSGSAKRSSGSFGGATDAEWDAASAKIPPRSGYLGGKRPALMLKGDKTPHFAGEKICVTNRNMVFTWRIETIDFRSYTHDLKRVSAQPLTPDKEKTP